jgi:thiol:disulfide interchange protein DsbD
MPFGLIFGALFFGLFCGAISLQLLLQPTLEAKLGGALLGVLGGSLALGLLMRRSWARWCGTVVGLLLAGLGLRLVLLEGGVVPHVALFAALAAAVLLAIPATGDPARGATPPVAAASRVIGPLGWTALVSFVGLVLVGLSVDTEATASAAREGALPASAMGKRVEWTDFDSGLARAQAEGKPVLATFVTDWCPYCTKMSRKTWRASSVASRLEDLVAVRVDAESTNAGGGPSGSQLAARYGIGGYPAQLLLDHQGRVIARFDGYQTADELLKWLDRALADATGASF